MSKSLIDANMTQYCPKQNSSFSVYLSFKHCVAIYFTQGKVSLCQALILELPVNNQTLNALRVPRFLLKAQIRLK